MRLPRTYLFECLCGFIANASSGAAGDEDDLFGRGHNVDARSDCAEESREGDGEEILRANVRDGRKRRPVGSPSCQGQERGKVSSPID